jgi:hypothetical protein
LNRAIAATIQSMRARLHNDPNSIVVPGTRHFNFSAQALTKNTRVALRSLFKDSFADGDAAERKPPMM